MKRLYRSERASQSQVIQKLLTPGRRRLVASALPCLAVTRERDSGVRTEKSGDETSPSPNQKRDSDARSNPIMGTVERRAAISLAMAISSSGVNSSSKRAKVPPRVLA